MPVERVLIDAARMELLANYYWVPAAEKFYNDQDSALVACTGMSRPLGFF